MVDAESMLVVVPQVANAATDKEQVAPMVAGVQVLPEGLNQPKAIVIGNGYFSEKNVEICEAADVTPVEKMKHTLKTKAGRALYALRKQTVEPGFGIIKSVMGFRQFLLCGLDNVQIEWTLVCLAWNLKRMAVLRPQ